MTMRPRRPTTRPYAMESFRGTGPGILENPHNRPRIVAIRRRPGEGGMLLMALATSKVVPWTMVGFSGLLASASSWDTGVILTSVGGVGMALIGLFFEYRRRGLEADKAEALDRIETIKAEAVARAAAARVEAEGRVELERLALESQIALDRMREEKYAGTMTQQLAELKASLEAGNARVEDANKKLHELRKEAQAAALTFQEERSNLTRQLDDLRRDYADLLVRMDTRISANADRVQVHDAEIADLKSGSGFRPAIRDNARPMPDEGGGKTKGGGPP